MSGFLPCHAAEKKGSQAEFDADAVFYWLSCRQNDQGLVVAEGKENFTVEEEASAALAFLARGHYHRAERILNYFYDLYLQRNKEGTFRGFYRYYQLNGEPLSSELLVNTQLWLLVAINDYTITTGSKRFAPLADVLVAMVMAHEGPEHGFAAGTWGTSPLAYFTSADNLLACLVFSRYWRWTTKSEYRLVTWNTFAFTQKFLFNEKEKKFRRRIYQDDYELTENLWAALIFGKDQQGWVTFGEPNDLYNLMLIALLYNEYQEEGKYRNIMDAAQREIVWSPLHMGAAGLPVMVGGKDIDIFTTCWFLLAMERKNVFAKDWEFWENKIMLSPEDRQFKGDDFEKGQLEVLLGYPDELIGRTNCNVLVDWDSDSPRTGKGALRIFFSPSFGTTNAEAIVVRRFLEVQDFSTFSSIKVWTKAAASVRIGHSLLKVNLAFVDADDEVWYSPDMSVMGPKGFINTVPFPTTWQRHPSSKGNNVFDVTVIKELRIYITQPNDVQWQVYFDDLTLQ